MSLSLKNAGGTYQIVMTALFHDMTHKEMEVYVNYMIAKPKVVGGHLVDLRKIFERLRKYILKLNRSRCVLGQPQASY